MRGIELGRSMGAIARGSEAPKVAMSMNARFWAREFAPIKIANKVSNISPLNPKEVVAQAEGILGFSRPTPVREPSPGSSSRALSEASAPINIKPVFAGQPIFKPEPKRAPRTFVLPARILKADYIPQSSPVVKSGEKAVPGIFAEANQMHKTSYELKSQPVPAEIEQPIKTTLQPQNQEVESMVEALVPEERQVEDIKEDEDVLELKKVYLEDEGVSETRRYELKEAIKKAFAQVIESGLDKITGALVAKFLPGDHEDNRSQIIKKKGPDGSYERILQEVAHSGDFYTEEQAQQVLDKILQTNRPVKLGKNNGDGPRVTIEEVRKVLRPNRVNPAVLEFVTRVVKKRQIRQKVVEYGSSKVEEQTIYGN